MSGEPPPRAYAAPDLRSRAVFEAEAAGCYERIVRAVYLATGDAAGAEDAVQDALAKAWRHRRSIRSLPAFLTQAALNQARSSWRRRRREVTTDPSALPHRSTDDRPDGAALGGELRAALMGLPRRQREATVLHDYLGFTFEEAAEILGTSSEALRNAAFHARRELRQQVPQLGGDASDVH
jgi:RNA polymerase sigma factor (sigma-70 family)